MLEDIVVSSNSWEYLVDFMILAPKNNVGGHPLILGRPLLAIANYFISCRSSDMFIFDGSSTKRFILHPPTKTKIEVGTKEWIDDDIDIQKIFATSKIGEENHILNLMECNESSSYC